jgi:uncharacterized protein involved in exopolysaccharide biosynthesis
MRCRSLFILTGALTCLVLSGCQSNNTNKIYTATALIQIEPFTFFTQIGSQFSPYTDQSIFQPDLDMMQASDTLLPIIKELNLDKKWAKQFKSNQNALSPAEALGHIHKILTINFKRETSTVSITAQSEEPQEAADIANAVVDHYKTMRDTDQAQRLRRGIDVLRNEIINQQKIVDEKKTVVERLRVSNNTSSSRRAQQELERQQYILDSYVEKLKQVMNENPPPDNLVRIVSRAVPSK